jgi:hypothetical protein
MTIDYSRENTMNEVEAFVWHDQDGNITAVGRPVAGSEEKVHPLVHGDRRVLKLSVSDEYLPALPFTHKIDVTKGTLIRREPESAARTF